MKTTLFVVFGFRKRFSAVDVIDALTGSIGARKYFYPLTNTFECFRGKFDTGETPVALDISKKVLTLPLYPALSKESVDRICDIIEQNQGDKQ